MSFSFGTSSEPAAVPELAVRKEKSEAVAGQRDVTDEQLYFARQMIQDELLYELAGALLKGNGARFEPLKAFTALGSRSFFGNFSIGSGGRIPNSFEMNLQRQLGQYLTSDAAQLWIRWFLAYPIGRKSRDDIVKLRAAFTVSGVAPSAHNVEFFFTEANVNAMLVGNPLAQASSDYIKREEDNVKEQIGDLSDGEKNFIRAAVIIDWIANFLLTESQHLPATFKGTFPDNGANADMPLEHYALTALSFGMVSPFVAPDGARLTRELEGYKETKAYVYFGYPSQDKNADAGSKFLVASALPWLSAVAFFHMTLTAFTAMFTTAVDKKKFQIALATALRPTVNISFAQSRLFLYSNKINQLMRYYRETPSAAATNKQKLLELQASGGKK